MLQRLQNLTIQKKLWLNAGLGLLSIFLIWLFIAHITRSTDRSIETVQKNLTMADAASETARYIRQLADPARDVIGEWNVVDARNRFSKNLTDFVGQFEKLMGLYKSEENLKVKENFKKMEAGASKITEISHTVFMLADEKVTAEGQGKMINAQAAMEKAIEQLAKINQADKEVFAAMEGTVGLLQERTNALLKENQVNNQRFSGISLVLFLASLIITLAVSYLIAKSVSRSVGVLQEAVQAISGGSLNYQIQIEGRGEISDLARSFSKMTFDLRNLVSRIQDNSKQIATASEELSASSQQMSANSEEAERLASNVSSASEQTNRNVHTVATSAEEMSATFKEISKDVQKATEITSKAVTVAESTNATITKLGESSQEIGKVIKVITSIAQQTNLLALNATIEAARAGEAGKGFAVVANEVKDLAKKTAKATEEIGQRIGAIQNDTREAVSAIDEIGKVIGQINEISTTIAGALEEQAATTNEISRNVAEAAKGTSEVAQSIGGVVTASKGTAEGAANVLSASKSLAKMGSELASMVSRFDIDSQGLDGTADRQGERHKLHTRRAEEAF